MRVRELESFVVVAEELPFGRAAARLNLAQQPLSQNIRKLEARLGVMLFERTTRKVSLSAAGEAFLPSARSALRLLGEGREAARRVARGEAQRLIVGYVESALHRLLPPILQEFRTQQPACALELQQGCSNDLLAMLLARELHAAVFISGTTLNPTQMVPDALAVCELAREQVMVALSPGHPLAGRQQLPLTALAGQPFVMYAPTQKASLYDQIMHLCQSAGFMPQIVQEASSEGLMVSLVASGVGLALVPDTTVGRRQDVAYVPLVQPEVSLIYSLAWNTQQQPEPLQHLLKMALGDNIPISL